MCPEASGDYSPAGLPGLIKYSDNGFYIDGFGIATGGSALFNNEQRRILFEQVA
jgi:hypothetical protein